MELERLTAAMVSPSGQTGGNKTASPPRRMIILTMCALAVFLILTVLDILLKFFYEITQNDVLLQNIIALANNKSHFP